MRAKMKIKRTPGEFEAEFRRRKAARRRGALCALNAMLALLAVGVLFIAGCAAVPHLPTVPGSPAATSHHLTDTPVSLKHFSITLEWAMGLGLVAVAIGVALYFLVPETHRLSFALAGGGGGLLIVAMVLKPILWLVPWVGYSLLGLAFATLCYELWRNCARFDAVGSSPATLPGK